MTRVIPFAVALLLAFASDLYVHSARAEAPSAKATPLYVLSIWTEDADDQADALTQALRSRVQQVAGWSLLQASQSFETFAIALKCPPKPDPACLQRIGDQLKADHYVWGTMDKKRVPPGEVSVDLHLWARGKPDANARESYADSLKDPNDETLRTTAAGLFGKLTGAGSPAPNLVSGGLQALPLTTPPPPQSVEPAAEPDRGSPARTLLAYSAVAVGAGLLVASAVEAAAWVSDSNRSTDDRRQVPKTVTDVCGDPLSVAQDACSKGKDAVTASTLGWIFAGVGAALAGTGIWLIATDHPSGGAQGDQASLGHGWTGGARAARPALRVELLPSVGPRASAVDVRVSF